MVSTHIQPGQLQPLLAAVDTTLGAGLAAEELPTQLHRGVWAAVETVEECQQTSVL
jgi:hypothetical protein